MHNHNNSILTSSSFLWNSDSTWARYAAISFSASSLACFSLANFALKNRKTKSLSYKVIFDFTRFIKQQERSISIVEKVERMILLDASQTHVKKIMNWNLHLLEEIDLFGPNHKFICIWILKRYTKTQIKQEQDYHFWQHWQCVELLALQQAIVGYHLDP